MMFKGKEASRKMLETRKWSVGASGRSGVYLRTHLPCQLAAQTVLAIEELSALRESFAHHGTVLDIVENFACLYQHEVQSAHCHHEQVTIHPVYTYYKCPNCEACLTESVICVSGASRHDHHALLTFGTSPAGQTSAGQSRCAVMRWLWSTVQEQGALSSVTLCSDEMAVEHSTRARGP